MGFDHWGLAKFKDVYGDGQVEVVANGRFASIVRGLKKKAVFDEDMLKAELDKKVKATVEAIGEVEFDSTKNEDVLKLDAFAEEVKKALEKVFNNDGDTVAAASATAATSTAPAKVIVTVTTADRTITLVSTMDAKEITTEITGVTKPAPAVTATTKAINAYKVNTTADEVTTAKKAITDMEAALNKAKDAIKVGRAGTGANGVYQNTDVENAVKIAMSKAKVKNFDLTKVKNITITYVKDNEYTLKFDYTLPTGADQTSNTVSVMFEM